ncbi:MAG: amidohydrolase family protein [Gemmatimonadota bacterium]
MPHPTPWLRPSWPAVLATLTVAALAGCAPAESGTATDATVFEGARVVVGDGSAPIDDAVFVVQDGRFTQVGVRGEVEIPGRATHVDLTGKTVIPALVNAHVHLSVDRPSRTLDLQHMAYYGTGTALSLGLDSGSVAFAMRDERVPDGSRALSAGRGITSPEPGRTEVPYWVTTEAEARAAVQELAAQQVDFVKIWVDDRGGQYERLSPPLYGAVIDEAHRHGLPVTAHIFRLEDAKGLIRAGVDAFAHGVRDQEIDDELVTLWQAHPNVVLVPNLPDPGVAQDLSWLSGTVPPDELARMQDASVDRPAAQASFAVQARNLARLSESGIRIAFGTDGNTPWAVHQEMEDMVRSGMTPAAVLAAATGTSAALLGLEDVGTIGVGTSADFVVLNGNPLTDITRTRAIDRVYLRGVVIDRAALSARLLGSAAP